MPQLDFFRKTPFTPQQMLELVSDLKSYPKFVPNCSAMEVRALPDLPGVQCDAKMHIRFGPISQNYVSRVDIDRDEMRVSATSRDNPFSHLSSQWSFTPNGEGCEVRFKIDFSFSNPLIAAVAEPAFANMQGEILDAFMAEAKRRYA